MYLHNTIKRTVIRYVMFIICSSSWTNRFSKMYLHNLTEFFSLGKKKKNRNLKITNSRRMYAAIWKIPSNFVKLNF